MQSYSPLLAEFNQDVRLLLAPLASEDVKTVRCLGLNYEQHAKESNMPLPTYPVLFYKPLTSLAGPFDNIPVPAMAQEVDGLDYECELVAVIGKEAREVPESKALDYVMGYAVGDDVSHREWQLKRGGGQWALGKGFVSAHSEPINSPFESWFSASKLFSR